MDNGADIVTLLRRIATEKNRYTIGQLLELYNHHVKHISQLEMDNLQLTLAVNKLYQYLQGSEKTIADLKEACKTLINKYHDGKAN